MSYSAGFVVLGCRTNQYEGDALASMMADAGARIVPPEEADVAVVVTCTVTAAADRKTRQAVRRVRRKNPRAFIIATGCWAQDASYEEARALGADVVVGNRMKHAIPSIAAQHMAGHKVPLCTKKDLRACREWDDLYMTRPRFHTRAFIKVQDGCSHGCSYCVVPAVRGMSVSRSLLGVLREIYQVVASGTGEVVLTGVHLGTYRHDECGLPELVRAVTKIDGLKRLRFGSLEPFAVTDELLSVLRDSPLFCPHLHLPLQSGDDGVLSAMRRGYSAADFARTVERVRSALGEDLHISTDILLGYPAEDEAAFCNTVRLVRQLGLGRLHVFAYSPRRGTPEGLAADAVKVRMEEALGVAEESLSHYASRFVGRTVRILTERTDGLFQQGLTEHFIKGVCVGNDTGGIKQFVPGTLYKGVLTESDVKCFDTTDDVLP